MWGGGCRWQTWYCYLAKQSPARDLSAQLTPARLTSADAAAVSDSWLISPEEGASISPGATQLMRTFLGAQVAAALRCMAGREFGGRGRRGEGSAGWAS